MFKRVLLGSAMMSITAAALAAPTAELIIKGSIEPVACTVNFAGGGVVDYGVIATSGLKSGDHTSLPEKKISYNIDCEAAIAVATKVSDSRLGTASIPAGGDEKAYFGLGKNGEAKIGSYRLTENVKSTLVDGSPAAALLGASTPLGGWTAYSDGLRRLAGVSRLVAYSAASESEAVPGAFSKIIGELTINGFVAPTKSLNMSDKIELDGLAVMELVYL